MRLYFEVALRSFRQQFAYRAATLAGLFTNSVFGVFLASIFIAFYRAKDSGETAVAGWTVSQTVTLIWINQSLLMVVFLWGWWEIATRIQSGEVVTDLLKPLSYYGYWFGRDAGRAAAQLVIRFIPTLTIGALLFDLEPPASLPRACAFLASIVLAVSLSFTWRFMLNITAFWVIDYRGVNFMATALINILSGMLMPIAFFPDAIRPIIAAMPFRGIVQMPSEIYLGQTGVWQGLLFQLGWLAAMIALAQWLFQQATRKVVIQGG